jgi:hypothetical protein
MKQHLEHMNAHVFNSSARMAAAAATLIRAPSFISR